MNNCWPPTTSQVQPSHPFQPGPPQCEAPSNSLHPSLAWDYGAWNQQNHHSKSPGAVTGKLKCWCFKMLEKHICFWYIKLGITGLHIIILRQKKQIPTMETGMNLTLKTLSKKYIWTKMLMNTWPLNKNTFNEPQTAQTALSLFPPGSCHRPLQRRCQKASRCSRVDLWGPDHFFWGQKNFESLRKRKHTNWKHRGAAAPNLGVTAMVKHVKNTNRDLLSPALASPGIFPVNPVTGLSSSDKKHNQLIQKMGWLNHSQRWMKLFWQVHLRPNKSGRSTAFGFLGL